MGTHPIFESDFDCLTDRGYKQITNFAKKTSLMSFQSRYAAIPGAGDVVQGAIRGAVDGIVNRIFGDSGNGSDRERYEKEIAALKKDQLERDDKFEKKLQSHIDKINDKDKEIDKMKDLIKISQEKNELKRKEMLSKFEDQKNEQLKAQKIEYEKLMEQNKREEQQRLEKYQANMQKKVLEQEQIMNEKLANLSA